MQATYNVLLNKNRSLWSTYNNLVTLICSLRPTCDVCFIVRCALRPNWNELSPMTCSLWPTYSELKLLWPSRWLVVGVLRPGNIYSHVNWPVTLCTHDDVIMLFHWNTRSPAPWYDIPLSHLFLILSQQVIALARKRQVLIFKSLVWLNRGSHMWVLILRSPNMGDRCSTY